MEALNWEKNILFNLINEEIDIGETYLYVKDPKESKYYLFINKRENSGLKHFNDSKVFVKYSNDVEDIYKNIEEQSPIKKRKMMIAFDVMIVDMLSNNKLTPIVNELFTRGRTLNISLTFLDNLILLYQKILD